MSKIIFYRGKCVGCGICFERLPGFWRMSRKDGKATLVKSIIRKDVFILPVSNTILQQIREVAVACPVKIIKIV